MVIKYLTIASFLSTALASLRTPIHTRSTLPDVIIKALPAGCASYPGYDSNTRTAGPRSLTVAAAENSDLVNVGPTTTYSSVAGSQGSVMRWGYLNLGYRFGIARTQHQCTEDKLNVFADTSLNRAGKPGNPKWTPLVLTSHLYDAQLMYLYNGERPTLYEHYNGEETWAVKWYEANPTSYFYPFFEMRLLPEGRELDANETRIHLKIQVSAGEILDRSAQLRKG